MVVLELNSQSTLFSSMMELGRTFYYFPIFRDPGSTSSYENNAILDSTLPMFIEFRLSFQTSYGYGVGISKYCIHR